MGSVTHNSDDGMLEIGGEDGSLGRGRGGEKRIQFGLSGCHDTTLAAILSSLGAFEGEKWPAYSSHLAVELFRRQGQPEYQKPEDEKPLKSRMLSFGSPKQTKEADGRISRKSSDDLSQAEREKMDGYFVRLRYNDRPMTVPGCRPPGKHFEGDGSFCTLVSYRRPGQDNRVVADIPIQEAFKAICDRFTPKNWKEACASNLEEPQFPATTQNAGY